MSAEPTGAQLKGERRWIILKDGVPRELAYDFNALMAFEREFQLPDLEALKKLRERYPKGVPTGELEQAVREIGYLENTARWAYCLTESYREDNNEQMTWREFKRLLQVPPKEMKQAIAWQTATLAVLAQEHGVEEGNAEGEAGSDEILSSPSPSESPGDSSTTS